MLELASDAELEEIYSMLFGGWGQPGAKGALSHLVLLASRRRSSKMLLCS